jgi:hypothetical protein
MVNNRILIMERKYVIKASIWCIVTIVITDIVSYVRRGELIFLDLEYLRKPLLLLLFLLIVVGMVLGFAKFLSYQDKSKSP